MQWRVHVAGWWDDLRDSLGFLPAVFTIGAIAVARTLVAFEPPPSWVPDAILFGGTPDGARALLSGLAGATITVVGLVFSLTVVALQMASSQFAPRLMRTFLRDRGVQVVLSVMIASAVFDVVVLSSVRSSGQGVDPFVPRLAVTGALIVAGAAVALLVYFLHHVTHSLRVDVIIRSISRQTLKQLSALAPDRTQLPDEEPPAPPADTVAVPALRDGYLQLVDLAVLGNSLRKLGYRARIRPVLGEWVSEGTTLAWAWPDGSGTTSDTTARSPTALLDGSDVQSAIHRGLHLGADRTETADLSFGIRQLQDVALRALSTGVNDPSTAVLVVTQLSAIMVALADHPLGADTLTDDDGQVRLSVPRPTFGAYLDLVLGPLRRNAATDLQVLLAALSLLTDVAERVADTADRARAVENQLERLLAAADLVDAEDRAQLERAGEVVGHTLRDGIRPAVPTRAT